MTLEEASPAYAAMKAQRDELLGPRSSALAEEIRALEKQLRDHTPGAEADARVRKLLADMGSADDGDDAAPGRSEMRGRLAELHRQLDDVTRAARLVEQRMQTERGAASARICEQVRPEYTRRVRALCDALLATHRAQLDLLGLTDELERNDVAWTHLRPMVPRFLGEPRDNQGPTAQYLREAAQYGFLDAADIPERLR